jgi:hypothetical protein
MTGPEDLAILVVRALQVILVLMAQVLVPEVPDSKLLQLGQTETVLQVTLEILEYLD